jgi:Amt family ammonium transporter
VSEEAELIGLDEDQIGEMGYDYVAVRRDVDYHHHNFPSSAKMSPNGSVHDPEKTTATGTTVPVSNERAATAPNGQ